MAVYMPVDCDNHKSFDNFMEQLGDLDGVLSSVNFNSCICVGDFNVDLWKTRSTQFSKALRTFIMYNHGMCVLNGNNLSVSQDTWFFADYKYSSRIDYAIVTQNIMSSNYNMDVIDSEVWNSDHIPVTVSIPFDWKQKIMTNEKTKQKGRYLAWYQVNEEQLIRYSESVGRLLDVVSVSAEAAICCEPGTCEHVVSMFQPLRSATMIYFLQFLQQVRRVFL